MSRLIKKFLRPDSVDGSKIKLLNGESLRAVNASGTGTVELLKFNSSNALEFLVLPQVSAQPTLNSEVAPKLYVDQTVLYGVQIAKDYSDERIALLVDSAPALLNTLNELALALGSDQNFAATIAGQIGSLDSRLDTLDGGDTVVGSVAKAAKDALDSAKSYADGEVALDRTRLVALEADATSATAVGQALTDAKAYTDQQVLLDRQRLDAIESSGANAADLTALTGRVDTVEGRATTLEGRATTLEGQASALEGRANAVEGRATTLEGQASALEGRATAVEGDVATLKGDATVAGSVAKAAADALQSAQTYADGIQTALDGRLDTLEGDVTVLGSVAKAKAEAITSANSYADGLRTAMDIRVTALEAVGFVKEKKIVDMSMVMNGYIDLTAEAKPNSVFCFMQGGGQLVQGDDYTLSTVGGVTRLTFAGEFANGGVTAIESGDVVTVQYQASNAGTGGGGGGGESLPNDLSQLTTPWGDWQNLLVDISTLNQSLSKFKVYVSYTQAGNIVAGMYKNGILQQPATVTVTPDGNAHEAEFNFGTTFNVTPSDVWQVKFDMRPYQMTFYSQLNLSPALTLYSSNRGTYPNIAYSTDGVPLAPFVPGAAPTIDAATFNIKPNQGHIPYLKLNWTSENPGSAIIKCDGALVTSVSSAYNSVQISGPQLCPSPSDSYGFSSTYSALTVMVNGGESAPLPLTDALTVADVNGRGRAFGYGVGSGKQVWSDWDDVQIDVSYLNLVAATGLRLCINSPWMTITAGLYKNGVLVEPLSFVDPIGASVGNGYYMEPRFSQAMFVAPQDINTDDIWLIKFDRASFFLFGEMGSLNNNLTTSNRGDQGNIFIGEPVSDPFAALALATVPSYMGATVKLIKQGTGADLTVGQAVDMQVIVAYYCDFNIDDQIGIANSLVPATASVLNLNQVLSGTDVDMVDYLVGRKVGDIVKVTIPTKTTMSGKAYQSFFVYIYVASAV